MAWNACQKTPGFPALRIRIFHKQPRGSYRQSWDTRASSPGYYSGISLFWVLLSLVCLNEAGVTAQFSPLLAFFPGGSRGVREDPACLGPSPDLKCRSNGTICARWRPGPNVGSLGDTQGVVIHLGIELAVSLGSVTSGPAFQGQFSFLFAFLPA